MKQKLLLLIALFCFLAGNAQNPINFQELNTIQFHAHKD